MKTTLYVLSVLTVALVAREFGLLRSIERGTDDL